MEPMIVILFFWNLCLSIAVILIARCQNNQEVLLYLLRDEINEYKRKRGHIFVKNVDEDFTCPKMRGKND